MVPALGFTLGLSLSQRPASPGIVAPGLAPFFDTFNGDGLISARAGWSVQTTTAQASFANVLSTLSGNLRSTNSAANAVSGYHLSGAGAGESRGWYKQGETISIGFFEAHGSIDAANGRTGMASLVSGSLNTSGSILYQNSYVNAAVTSRQLATALLPGFVVENRTVNDAGTMRMQTLLNGRRIQPTGTNATDNGTDIATALGRALNGNYGFAGNIASPGARMVGTSNTATDAWITVVSAGGVRQTGKEICLTGEYGGARAPRAAELTVTAYNAADDSVVAGFNSVAVSNFTAAGGTWSATIANPETDNIWLDVKWAFKDTGGADAFSNYPTATFRKGDVIVVEGQSQVEFISTGGAADTTNVATAQMAYVFQAHQSQVAVRRVLALANAATSNWAALTNPVQALTGRPTQIVSCAQGGSPYSTRNKPSAQYDATLEGIKAVGGSRLAMMCLCGGTSGEAGGTIYDNILKLANDLDADLGVAQLYGIMPEGNDVGVGSGTYSTNRRLMWKLTKDFPARFKLLGFRNELQHNIVGSSVDPNHYAHPSTSVGYVNGTTLGDTEFARRIGVGVAYHLYGGPDYRGPRITTATAPSKTTTTVRIYVDCGAFDGLAIANTAYASDFTGGFEFNSVSDFGAGTVLIPNAVAFGAPVAGIGYVEWTFAAVLPGSVYARCAMGDDPFNRSSVLAISQNMQARASYLVGTKSGVVPAAIWPSYDVGGAGVDYLTI